ncbi:MAG: type IV pilus assembly protein PilM [Patescibacteria group bacterium]
MSFFYKTRSYLGVDLGTASIKIVELENRAGTPTLLTYGFAELPVDEIKFDVHETVARTAKTVAKICAESHTKSRKVIAALPTFSVFSSVITLPVMNEKEVGQALTYEAKKIIPLPIEEMVLDWKILKDKVGAPASNKKDKTMRVLLTAAPRTLVKKYQDIFQAANLELLSLETEAFALERSLLGSDPAVTLLLDVGALTTDLVIVEDHVPILNRSIDVGGVTATKAIAQSLNVNEHRAEQFKRDVGMISGGAGSGGVGKVIENTFSPIINEIKYALSLYRVESTSPLEKIILTGGSAWLPNLSDYLATLFQVKVIIGDPWAAVSYPTDIKGVLQELGPRFGTAVGLAMREIKSS